MIASSYLYTARDADGRLVCGVVEAESSDHALGHLRNRSLFVTSIEHRGSPRAVLRSSVHLGRIDTRTKVAFFRAFATLIGSGVSMLRALDVVLDGCRNARFAEAIRSLRADIESGLPLSASMARRPSEFAAELVEMIRAGELGGILDEVLSRIASLLERNQALRLRVYSALAYPAIVSVTAMLLVVFLVANTVPAFASMFGELHVRLPLVTRLVMAVGGRLRDPFLWGTGISVAAAAALCVSALRHKPAVRGLFDRAFARVPIAGPIFRKSAIARLLRTLGALVASGVPLVAAVDVARGVVAGGAYAQLMDAVSRSLNAGSGFADSLASSPLIEPLVLQLIRVGEEAGSLDSMLLRVAEYYELDVDVAIATLGAVLEPVLILVLGAIVGTIIASILIPLYSIIGSIK